MSRLIKHLTLIFLLLSSLELTVSAQEQTLAVRLKPVYVKGKWGYADRMGKMVIAAQFDAARPFVDGLAQVGALDEELPEIERQPNLKWGYIDERGRVRVELRYAYLREFSEGLAAAAMMNAEKNGKPILGSRLDRLDLIWGYVDPNGREVIPLQFLDAGDFAEGLAQVNVGKASESMCATPGNFGFIDKSGAFVIKPQFSMAAGFQNGRARVSIGQVRYLGRCVCCAPHFYGKHGYVDRSGNFVADKTQPDDIELEGWEN